MVNLIDYSERAIALVGDTKQCKDLLKSLGGKYNPRLSCGSGWVFSRRRRDALTAALQLAGIEINNDNNK